MSEHVADPDAPRPRPHHYMNAGGFCHAGDMFEAGAPAIPVYDAHELVRIVNSEKAEAWLEGWYHATNGKWGPPEPGANPYGEVAE